MKLKKLLFSFFFAIFFLGNYSYAANINWDGGGDGTSWTDPLNWAGDVMPGAADRAVFPSPVGAVTVVKGPGTPNPIMGLWVFNNVDLGLDLDLMVNGQADPVRVFRNNTLTFMSGYTFDIMGTTRGIAYFNNNSTIIIEEGATVNVTAPQGIGTNANAAVATLINRGTLNITAVNHAMRPNDASAWSIINEACGVINIADKQIRVWSTGAVSSFVNNGLVIYTGNGAGVSVSGSNTSTNNAFYDYSSGVNFLAAGNGTKTEIGINVANAGNLVVDAASSCGVADLGIEGAYEFFSDAAGANSVGTSTAGGAIAFDADAFTAAGTQTIYTCHGNAFAFTVNNVDGACIAPVPPVPTLSQWGLIVLGLMMMIAITLRLVVENKTTLVTASGQTIDSNIGMSNLPFEKSYFFKAFVAVIALFTIVFAVSISAFGYEMTASDPYGTMVASGLIAYWLMLYKLEKK